VAADERPLEAGDVVWIDFGIAVGHEQAGRRPALVVSPSSYNQASSLLVVCPITRNDAPWPFKVPLPPIGRVTGAVVVDQIRAVDPVVRHCHRFGAVAADVLDEVRRRLSLLTGLESPT